MKSTCFLLALPFFALMASCQKNVLVGTGPVVTREVTITAAESVALHYGIELRIQYDATPRLVVTGYENLINAMPNKVVNGHLDITLNNGYERVKNNNLKAILYLPLLKTVSEHGSGKLTLTGFENGEALEVKQHGSGAIEAEANNFTNLTIKLHGSGKVDFEKSNAAKAEIHIHGSGNVLVKASQALVASVYGSGSIFYWGNPQITTQINGSGKVIKKG
ncbi:MAG: DUF2807 domain-containing protein [Chitinophagaceae bacterium]|nr:DUF2807 domain-containing protein [Chitinophagaceae bacterium]